MIPALFNKWIIHSDVVLLLLDHGSSVGMLPSFPISLSKSRVYFVWEMKIPFLLLVTSIPGKCCSCPRSLTTNSDYRHYYCSILQILGVVSYKLSLLTSRSRNHFLNPLGIVSNTSLLQKKLGSNWVYHGKRFLIIHAMSLDIALGN